MPTISLLNDDCMNVMQQYPDKYFDLAIVDPPYCIGASKPSKKPETVKQKNGTILKVNSSNYQPKEWDFELMDDNYFKELFRVSKNQIIFGANYYKQLSGGMIVWDKLNGLSDQYGCEIAYQSFDKRTDVVYYMWQGMFQGVYCGKEIKKALIQQGDKSQNESRIHPTQKPVKLYQWLLNNYAKKGDKILDTHLGSGSIAIACHEYGFDLVASELDPDYYKATMKRFNEHAAQQLLFS